MIEEELFRDDYPFWACYPTKVLLRPDEALEAARQLGVFARRDFFVRKWDDRFLIDSTSSQNADIAIARGKGVLTGEKRLKVSNFAGDEITLEAKYAVVLATGSSPIIPDIPGLKDVMLWTPREATASDHVPEHSVILGVGVAGCGMATFYRSFQKQVTLISSGSALLPRFEPEAGKRVQKALEERAVSVQFSAEVKAFHNKGEGLEAELSNGRMIMAKIPSQ